MNTKRNVGKLSRMAAIATAATSLVLVGIPTSPVQAAQVNCSSWPNPASAINNRTVKSVSLYGRTIELRSGYINGVLVGWARMVNSSASTDRVWMDVSYNNGVEWDQCGPFFVSARQYTPAKPADLTRGSKLRFRACGDVRIGTTVIACTNWW